MRSQLLDLARLRYRSHELHDPTTADPAAVVGRLLGVQAENESQALWAVASRTTLPDLGRVTSLLADATILRTHVLRPTWHFVLGEDLGWLGGLCRPRLLPLFERQLAQLGIDQVACRRGLDAINSSVASGPRTRRELADELAASGLDFDGRAMMLLAAVAELHEVVCSGPPRQGTHTYASFGDRVRFARRLDRDEALAELALRYFTGHGPASVRDLAYWATLPLRDVRAGLSDVASQLGSVEVDDTTYWYRPDLGDIEVASVGSSANLLQILDEYYRGYQHTRSLLDIAGLRPQGRETSTGMVLIDSQMVGTMTRFVADRGVRFEVRPFGTLTAADEMLICDAAARYGRFLGRKPAVTFVAPR